MPKAVILERKIRATSRNIVLDLSALSHSVLVAWRNLLRNVVALSLVTTALSMGRVADFAQSQHVSLLTLLIYVIPGADPEHFLYIVGLRMYARTGNHTY